jgi:S-(hydroxymethyl)glutathione dehydrogenase/alcohol dehydrogenase
LCLLGCGFTTGFGAVTNAAHIRPGETVTIVGCGGLGLAAVQGAVSSGAGKIIAIDVHEAKLSMAKKFGATHTIQSRHNVDEVIKEVMDITWGQGTDYSFEFVGGSETDETAQLAFKAIRKGGSMFMVGVGAIGKKTMPIDPYTLALWRKKLQGVLFGDAQFQADIPRYVDLYEQKKINLDDMITKYIQLDQVNEAFEDIFAGNKVARSVIRFS